MRYEDKLYYVLSTAINLEAPTYEDIRDAINEAKELGLPIHLILPDLITTNIAFIYEVDGKVHSDIYSVSSITVNIEKKINEYVDKGYDVIGFIHTHTPQPVMPSIDDVYAIFTLQSAFPECVSAIKRSGFFDTVFAFQLNLSSIYSYFEKLKDAYSNTLNSIEPNMVLKVPDVLYKKDETIHITSELPIYDEEASTMLDTITMEFLMRNNIVKNASYNRIAKENS